MRTSTRTWQQHGIALCAWHRPEYTLPAHLLLMDLTDGYGVLQNLKNVVGDILIAAGTIAYSGPFTPAFRQSLQQEWTTILQSNTVRHTEDANLIETLQVDQPCQTCNAMAVAYFTEWSCSIQSEHPSRGILGCAAIYGSMQL